MAQHIKATGEITEVSPANGKNFSLKELQDMVGGYFELVYIIDSHSLMAVNEDGRMLNLKYNTTASDKAGQSILGDVVLICNPSQIH